MNGYQQPFSPYPTRKFFQRFTGRYKCKKLWKVREPYSKYTQGIYSSWTDYRHRLHNFYSNYDFNKGSYY